MTEAELRKLALAATEGPWIAHSELGGWAVCYKPNQYLVAVADYLDGPDAAYIAAANPQTMIELLDSKRAMQAQIDMLMLEYCPEDMTKDQKAEWARNQVPCSDEATAELENALKQEPST